MPLSAPVGLYAEYSLAWCNSPVILLLSLLFTTLVFRATVQNAAADALKDINSLCGNLDSAVFSLANAPHALVQMLDNETEQSVKFVLNDTRQALLTAIDGVDGLLVFFIDTYKSTYVCLLSLAVNSAMDAITSISSYFESSVQNMLNGAATDVDGIAPAIDGSINGNDTSQYSSSVAWPNITSNWTTGLSGLHTKVQNFTLQTSVDTLVSSPFQDLKSTINQSLWATMKSTNFTSAIHNSEQIQWVPCNAKVLQQAVGDAEERLLSVTRTISYILIAIMISVILCNLAYRRSLNQWRLAMAQSFMETPNRLTHTHAMIALRAGHKPVVWRIMSLLGISPLLPRRAATLSWLIDYITHPAALLALGYGLCGLISTSLVIRVIEAVRDDVAEQFVADADAMLTKATSNLTASLKNTADQVVNNTNAAILDLENIVNYNALGWVNTTTSLLNNTLNQITFDIDMAVSTIFGGSILEDAAQGLLDCIILNKIQSIEKGLTWLNNVSSINLPRIPDGYIADSGLLPETMLNSVMDPVVGSEISHNSTLDRMFDRCVADLQDRLPQYYILISVWLFVLLTGVCTWLTQRKHTRKPKTAATWSPTRPSVWLHRRKVRPVSGSYFRPTAPRPAVTKAIIYRDRCKLARPSSLLSDGSDICLNVL